MRRVLVVDEVFIGRLVAEKKNPKLHLGAAPYQNLIFGWNVNETRGGF